ncbi:MAG: hypothetical protein PUD51_04070 [Prevotellaceae bacterium]|nr:hypothetical protein [Prevotellaceae bacterium]
MQKNGGKTAAITTYKHLIFQSPTAWWASSMTTKDKACSPCPPVGGVEKP